MLTEEQNELKAPYEHPLILNTIRYLIALLLKRWWLFLLVFTISGAIGYYYAKVQKPSYKSKLTFALDDGGGNGGNGFASLISQFGLGTGGGNDVFAGDNIIQILTSRRMIERVLLTVDTFENRTYTIAQYYLERSKSKTSTISIDFPVGKSRKEFGYLQDSVLKKIYLEFAGGRIKAYRPDRKLNIYEVNVTTADEKLTKVFTDRLVSETNNFYTEIRTKKAKQTLEILENRVAAMKGNLNSSIDTRAAVQDANANPAFAAAQIPVLKQQANIQVYSGAYAEMFKNLEIARFQYLKEIPLMQIIDPADYPMEIIKTGKLKTAIIFSVASCIILLFCIWFIRIIFLSRKSQIIQV
jgi:Chain length determinant protein